MNERMKDQDENELDGPEIGGGDGNRVKFLNYEKYDLMELRKNLDEQDRMRGTEDSFNYWEERIEDYMKEANPEGPMIISNSGVAQQDLRVIGKARVLTRSKILVQANSFNKRIPLLKLVEIRGGACLLVTQGDYKNMHVFKTKKEAQEFKIHT